MYVHDKIYDEYSHKFAEKSKELLIGDGLNESTFMGPLVNTSAVTKVVE
ncbi:aldehyde dehydrogenase family protein [Peribacillus frigoritolerans]|nr:aldehyde dehydrogenase family protein [Peribacillus frigoritolerans]